MDRKSPLLGMAEAAEYLDIELRTLRHLVDTGRLRKVKIAKYNKFLLSDLDAYIMRDIADDNKAS